MVFWLLLLDPRNGCVSVLLKSYHVKISEARTSEGQQVFGELMVWISNKRTAMSRLETALWLSVLAVLAEDAGFVSRTHIRLLITAWNSISGELIPSCDLHGLLHAHGTHTHTQTHQQIKQNKYNKRTASPLNAS